MSHSTSTLALTTGTRSRLLALIGVLAMLVPSLVFAPRAEAALPPATAVGGFEIDGNLLTDNGTPDLVPGTRDWDAAPPPSNDASLAGDDILVQGNNGGKENSAPYVFQGGNVSDKTDLTKIYLDSRITSATDAYIWAGFERVSGGGDAYIAFEFNQAATSTFHNRAAGDLRFSFAFTGQGQQENASVAVDKWNGSAWESAGTSYGIASTNSKTNYPPDGEVVTPDGRTLGEREFGEAGIDLRPYFLSTNFSCASFSTVWARTRASNAETANVFDMAGPYAIDVDLCSTIEVKKTDDSGIVMSGVEFTLYKDKTTGTVGQLDAGDTVIGTQDTSSTGIATFGDLETGSYFVRETEGSLTDYVLDTTVVGPILIGFLDTVEVWQDRDGAGPLTTGYTFVNTRKTGKLEVVKNVSGGDGSDVFDLLVKQGTTTKASATDVGHGGTTGETTLPTGTYTVSEAAGTGTTLDDYTSSVSCTDASDTVVASSTTGATVDVAVGHDDDITCTITNTRRTGKIELRKELSPTTDLGTFDLYIEDAGGTTVDSALGVPNGTTDSTGENVVDTGTYHLSEVAPAGVDLSDYVTTISCTNQADVNDVVGPVATQAGWSVAVGHDDDILCTLTNTRKTGQLTIVKSLSPTDDPGTFALTLGGTTKATGGHGTTTNAMTLNTGTYTVSEAAAAGATLADYVSTVACTDATDTVVASNSNGPNVDVTVGHDDDLTCTITNTRKTGKIELVKDLAPSDDPGTFDLFVRNADGTVTIDSALGVGDGGSTGENVVNTGTYQLSEVAGSGTDLSNYTAGLSCVLDGTQVAVAASGSGPWTVDVAHNQDVVCTIVNTRQTGTLTVVKDLSPSADPGLFTLSIDGVDVATDVGHGGSSGATTVNTGTHTVAESAGTGTTLDDYVSSVVCVAATQAGDVVVAMTTPQGAATSLSVSVGYGDDITCTVFNTRKSGDLTIVKDVQPDTDDGRFDLTLDGAVVAGAVGDGGTTGAMTLNTASYTVGEAAASGSVLGDYVSGVSCVDGGGVVASADGSSVTVDVTHGADIVCTITNTRIPHDLNLLKLDGDTGLPLPGVGFTLYASDGDGQFEPDAGDGAVGDEVLTDAQGRITWSDLQPGDYWVHETGPLPGHFPVSAVLVTIDDEDVSITISNTPHHPSINLTKTADVESASPGDVVAYTYVITNTGDVPLINVTLDDDVLGAVIGLDGVSDLTLAPRESVTRVVRQTVAESDLPGPLVNTAVATGTPPAGADVDAEATESVTLTSSPSIQVVKTPSTTGATVGDEITYTYVVTNTGDVTLTGVTVLDDLLGALTLAATTLAPGATTQGTLTYTVVDADLPGPIVNVATATGTPPVGADVSDSDDAQVSLTSTPAIEVVKTAQIEPNFSGRKLVAFEPNDADVETVDYRYVVTNTGDVTLTAVTLEDDVLGTVVLADTTLAPGDSTIGTATHVVTQQDANAGQIVNEAVANGTGPDGTVVEARDTETVDVTIVLPTIIERPDDPQPAPDPVAPVDLPRTGFDSQDYAMLAIGMLALGVLLLTSEVRLRRRRLE